MSNEKKRPPLLMDLIGPEAQAFWLGKPATPEALAEHREAMWKLKDEMAKPAKKIKRGQKR
jgi:hypothetical protein